MRVPGTAFERRIALLTHGMVRWGVGCPFVFQAELLDANMEQLFLDRFRGTDALSRLVDEALQASVASAPR